MKKRPHEAFCKKDQDGRCQVCHQRLIHQFREYVNIFEDLQKKVVEIVGGMECVCSRCMDSGIDFALAMLCRELKSRMMEPCYIEAIARGMKNTTGDRVKKYPLLDKVIQELQIPGDGGED